MIEQTNTHHHDIPESNNDYDNDFKQHDSGAPNVSGKQRSNNHRLIGGGIFMSALLALAYVFLSSVHLFSSPPPKAKVETINTNIDTYKPAPLIKPKPIIVEKVAPTPVEKKTKPEPITKEIKPVIVEQEVDKSISSLLINGPNDSGEHGNNSHNPINALNQAANQVITDIKQKANDLTPRKVNATKAHKLEFDPNLLLARGTYITCALTTRFVSDIAGEVDCVLTNDIYSANGKVLLLERGSKVFGEYQSSNITVGNERLFVLWDQIRTPNNVIVDINSSATDPLGGAGFDGYVNNHYMKRFGSALMLSMFQDFMTAATTRLSGNNNGNNQTGNNNDYQNTTTAIEDMANQSLKQSIGIPPTISKNQGDIVGIRVIRDVDFSDVYKLELKK